MSSDQNRSNRHKSEEELWSRKFSDSAKDSTTESQNSRVARSHSKKNKEGISPWLTGAVLLLALLFIAPITYTMWLHNRDAEEFSKKSEPNIEVVEKKDKEKKDKEKEEAEKEAKEKEEKEKAEKEKAEKEKKENQEEKPNNSQQAESAPAPESESTQESAPAQTGGSYTVQPGDTLYRIAANHGTTVDHLMAINGLSSPDIVVGQVLTVE
ncbi:LysM peptidoglycan-binding domain-containing protein [Allofustis seminis]|uniref:LysM peptidoglycan-binding domain-containing protein n=1 Tax=Allofustis seminis TaxID=166939 RepID=UPI0003774C27|nr:LysM peptidoglycan-binding domain-containing protein [Allofustis seminis]